MPQLSITNKQLAYGINVDEVFWVAEGILRRDDVRGSSDEQLVLDILIDCLSEPLLGSGPETRNAAYDYSSEATATPSELCTSLARTIDVQDASQIEDRFIAVYDVIREILASQERKFAALIGSGGAGRSPRYFHALFMALYELNFSQQLRVSDRSSVAVALDGARDAMQIPSGGGDWTAAAKRQSIDLVQGLIRSGFEGPIQGEDLATHGYRNRIETILSNARVEQQTFDCKQGFLRLDEDRGFDDQALENTARSLVAMSNGGPGHVGYVIVGIADSSPDVERIEEIDGQVAKVLRGFPVVGLEREALAQSKSMNDYWSAILQKLEAALPHPIGAQVASSARLATIDDLTVGLLRVESGGQVTFWGDEILDRRGSSTVVVEKEDYASIYRRF